MAPTLAQRIDNECALIPDYPQPGIIFRDLTPVFADGPLFGSVTDALSTAFTFDYVAGIEARGFILAGAIAHASGAGMLTIRKAGKLPRKTFSASYDLEYGSATLEIHQDAVVSGARVLIVDDVLATGGTLSAAADLVEQAGGVVAGLGVLMELAGLGGRERVAQALGTRGRRSAQAPLLALSTV